MWLQESAFGVWVAESIWVYPLVLTAHTVGLALLVGGSTLFNLHALRVGGAVPLAPLQRLVPVMMVGLVVNAATGLTLFIAAAQDRGAQLVFYVKLVLIAVALIVDQRLRHRLSARTVADGTARTASDGARELALGSLTLWAAAIVAGRLIAYL